MNFIKNNTISYIEEVYLKNGLEFAVETSNRILVETEHGCANHDDKSIIKGELGEMALFITLLDYQKKLKFKTILLKGLFVQDKRSGQVTEIDLIFITPYKIYLFECKSYSGFNKEIREIGTLFRDNVEIANVFEQSKLHALIFNGEYGCFTKKGSRPYSMILFDYATNKFVDKRNKTDAKMLTVLSIDNVLSWLMKDIESNKDVIKVNMDKMFESLSFKVPRTKLTLEKEHRRQLKY